jgi:histidine kinase/GAF domain-containing protein
MSHAPGEGITTLVALSGEPVAVEDAANDLRVAHRITDTEHIQSLQHVPIIVNGAVFGVFGVNYREKRTFAGEEERERLARELHDAVTQTLFSASLIAEVVPRLWDRDPEEGRNRVEDLRRLTRGALSEMRTLLLARGWPLDGQVPRQQHSREAGSADAHRSSSARARTPPRGLSQFQAFCWGVRLVLMAHADFASWFSRSK